MGTNFLVYPIEGNKKIFMNYRGAIREAIYLGCYVDNSHRDYQGGKGIMCCLFKVAGIENHVSWDMTNMASRPMVYWSLQDAIEDVNKIGWRGLSVQEFNNAIKGGLIMNEQFGYLDAFCWDDKNVVGVYKKTIFKCNQWTALYVDGQATLYKNIKTMEPLLIPQNCYKTIAECKANNRPKVITF